MGGVVGDGEEGRRKVQHTWKVEGGWMHLGQRKGRTIVEEARDKLEAIVSNSEDVVGRSKGACRWKRY